MKTKTGHISGILLSGGKNTRMGTNKAFLEIDGVRLINRTLDLYRRFFEDIIIVTNDPFTYLEFPDVSVVTDIYKGKGPLGGIYTGLFYAKNSCAFVSACDMPFLSDAFLTFLLDQTGRHDIVVPATKDGFQPLCAVYSRKCLPSILRLLVSDKLKISGFYRDMNVLSIEEQRIAPFNPDGRLFKNLNTPQDMTEIAPLA